MLKNARSSTRLLTIGMLTLCVTLGLTSACTQYNPQFYGYDVLVVSDAVKINPIGFIYFDMDGNPYVELNVPVTPGENFVIVNESFAQWVRELKQELSLIHI